MALKDMSIKTKLTAGFMTLTAALLIVGVLLGYSIYKMYGSTASVIESAPLAKRSSGMRLLVSDSLKKAAGMFVAPDKERVQELWGEIEKNGRQFTDSARAMKATSASLAALAPVGPAVDKALDFHDKVLMKHLQAIYQAKMDADEGNVLALAIALNSLQKSFDEANEASVKMSQMMAAIDAIVETSVKEAASASEATLAAAITQGVAGVAIGVILSLFLGYRITKGIVTPIRECTTLAQQISNGDLSKRIKVESEDEAGQLAKALNTMAEDLYKTIETIAAAADIIASSSEQLSATTSQLASGAQTQAAQTEQSASAMTEMSQTVLDVARNAAEVASTSQKTSELAELGRKRVEETAFEINVIAEAFDRFSKTIEGLGHSSEAIGSIIGTINEIADQTNLLALNAAIEAARAGEQGRGFAVVADEVRKLAERTGRATTEITKMIGDIQSEATRSAASVAGERTKIAHGVELAGKAMHALENIVSASEQIADMVQQIASAAHEQSTAVEHVSATIESIATVTRENETSTLQIQSSSEGLAHVAVDTASTIAWFKLKS